MDRELKTLKDLLGKDAETAIAITILDLRQEAIKWIKSIEKLNAESYQEVCLNCMNIQEDTYKCWEKGHYTTKSDWQECSDLSALLWFIKHFFNITKEELK